MAGLVLVIHVLRAERDWKDVDARAAQTRLRSLRKRDCDPRMTP
jgi:hypothetical protein